MRVLCGHQRSDDCINSSLFSTFSRLVFMCAHEKAKITFSSCQNEWRKMIFHMMTVLGRGLWGAVKERKSLCFETKRKEKQRDTRCWSSLKLTFGIYVAIISEAEAAAMNLCCSLSLCHELCYNYVQFSFPLFFMARRLIINDYGNKSKSTVEGFRKSMKVN